MVRLDRTGFSGRDTDKRTTDGEMMSEEPVRPVIDDDLVDRLMAQVDAEGLKLLGPEGVTSRLDAAGLVPSLRAPTITQSSSRSRLSTQIGIESGMPKTT